MHRPKPKGSSPLKPIQEQQFLHQLQLQQLEIEKIQKQRQIILSIQKTISKKDREIQRLTALVEKYQPSYQVQAKLRIELAEKDSMNKSLMTENQFLRKEFQQVLEECEGMNQKMREMERERETLIRQRLSIEVVNRQRQRMNRDIQETFKEYKHQCCLREEELVKELIQLQNTHDSLLKRVEEEKQAKKKEPDNEQLASLKAQVARLTHELSQRDTQLLKNRKLNHQLSIQFDRSVNKIVEFQHELKDYRKDNHELKKTLGMVLQQQKYQKLRNKYLKEQKRENINIDQQSLQEDDSSDGKSLGQDESSPELSSIHY